ncbi:hypothetical protein ACIRD9_42500 [Streptomyces violaceus]|uniref:hypothetical protein n=1 Tax=Streptomyces violaceus TaxID=1936 RepID=UPI0038245F1D
MVQPFRVIDQDDPGRDRGGWGEGGDVDLPGVLTVDRISGSGSSTPSLTTIQFLGMVEFLAAATFVATVMDLEGAAAGTDVLRTRVTNDADPRFSIDADGRLSWGDGSGAVDVDLYREAANSLRSDGYVAVDSGQADNQWTVWGGTAEAIRAGSAGGGVAIKEGANARMGRSTLVAGTVVVANTSVTAATEVFLTCQTPGGTPGFLRVSARTAGTSFTILSSSGTDTSVVGWLLMEPAS